ncbi:hypothetical protein FHL15_010438 [Xylaria flabelliformis]|uniref:Uncharacterized protein n=1 Tax=Xylaria flabelliformis TaxID=2512241 RepID=A0A553HL53_9PEZI|nr:hypothetical protein FHL15_010438 [Xylaria flabelliformis]
MFRLGMHRALFGGTGFGTNSFQRLTPTAMVSLCPTRFPSDRFPDLHTRFLTRPGKQRRHIHDGSSEQTSPSSSSPPQAKPKPQREREHINHAFARWSSVMDPRPLYQDVRDKGPLFNLSKIELDPNPEAAKQQWRHLCVEMEQKQKIANELWDQKKELEVRSHCAEADNIRVRDALASTTQKCKTLKANNAHFQEVIILSTKACKGLEADNESLQVRCKGAETELKETKDVLYIVSQAHKRLELDNARLSAKVLQHEKSCAAVRRQDSWAGLRESVFLSLIYVAMGLFPFVLLYSLFS